MQQVKVSLSESQIQFLSSHNAYGFRDRSQMVRTALQRLQQEVELAELEHSAKLYSEVYAEDLESQEWVEGCCRDWPT